jgi:hypothetical protein
MIKAGTILALLLPTLGAICIAGALSAHAQLAILLEQNDEWAVQRARYMTLESMAPLSDDPFRKLPAVAA